MKAFSKKSLQRLEEIAPHLLTRVSLAEEKDASFTEYVLPKQAVIYICYGCGYPPQGISGTWIIIEPSITRLRSFLQKEESERLFSQNIHSFTVGDEASLRRLAWFLFDKSFALIDGGHADFSVFASNFMRRLDGTAHLFNEYADFGILPIKNCIKNLTHSLINPYEYKDVQKGCDALVIGAGPSLDRSLDILKQVQKQVVLIGCGSAVQLLKQHGISIDFATYLDPAPPKDRYLDLYEATPLVFLSRTSSDVVSCFYGEKILVGSNECHPLETFCLQQAGIQQVMQGGWNAATLGIEWARFLGCKDIYTVGIDTTSSGYAQGIDGKEKRTEVELQETIEWIQEEQPIPQNYIPHGSKRKKKTAQEYTVNIQEIIDTLQRQCHEAKLAIEGILVGGKASLLHSFELEQNPLDEMLFSFLWEIWQDRFPHKNKWQFYQKVINEYSTLFLDELKVNL